MSALSSPLSPTSLAELAQAAAAWGGRVLGRGDVLCGHVTQDSRRVRPGSLFAVRSGQQQAGQRFVEQALTRGAVGLMLDAQDVETVRQSTEAVPLLVVDDLERALGPVAHAALGFPSRQVSVAGITGTNGKTTIASLCRQVLTLLGRPAASLGTLGYEFKDQATDWGWTTPPADIVAECVAQARDEGAQELVMEVSSHALSQHRIGGVEFSVAGYSNLSQDHLDYHGTLEEYGRVKASLFEEQRAQYAVLNVDDPHLFSLARRLEPLFGVRLLRVGAHESATLRLLSHHVRERTTCFQVAHRDEVVTFETGLAGDHNVSNWLVALGILVARGVALQDCRTAVERVAAAPGRLERCDTEQDDIAVLVDYAHTPDALARALQACRGMGAKQLWCVFGCGGDRDRSKRPQMGEVAARLADQVVITNDNPRTEDPSTIALDIKRGWGAAAPPTVLLDRREAIHHALRQASPGDLVLIAGKGHETYQIFGQIKHDFDDRLVARAALHERRPKPPVEGK